MNRTRKIAAAGILAAALLAAIVGMMLTPTLHTQTPGSASPPANGGTGTGTNNTTACNGTGDDREWDDANETRDVTATFHSLDDNRTNETGDHDADECEASTDDAAAQSPVTEDALAFVQALTNGLADVWNGLPSFGGAFLGPTVAPAFTAIVASR